MRISTPDQLRAKNVEKTNFSNRVIPTKQRLIRNLQSRPMKNRQCSSQGVSTFLAFYWFLFQITNSDWMGSSPIFHASNDWKSDWVRTVAIKFLFEHVIVIIYILCIHRSSHEHCNQRQKNIREGNWEYMLCS